MPPPGDTAARHAMQRGHARSRSGTGSTRHIAAAINFAADRLNYLQFLTIRRYLSLVFIALVILLLVLALWR